MLPGILRSLKRSRPSDTRSRRFVALIECALNQNARDEGAACSPAMDFDLLRCCHEHRVGTLQMPCPEIHALGFARSRPPGQKIRAALGGAAATERCAALADDVAQRIEAYLDQGYELIAVLGGNPQSPGCAVHQGSDGLREDSGLFMRLLEQRLKQGGHPVLFKAIRDHDPQAHRDDIAWLNDRLAGRPSVSDGR